MMKRSSSWSLGHRIRAMAVGVTSLGFAWVLGSDFGVGPVGASAAQLIGPGVGRLDSRGASPTDQRRSNAGRGLTASPAVVPKATAHSSNNAVESFNPGRSLARSRDGARPLLPVVASSALRLALTVETDSIPRPDGISLALKFVTGEPRSASGAHGQRGGLWVSGDTAEGLARLRWIVGAENAASVRLDPDGRVRFDLNLLANAAGYGATPRKDPLRAIEHISSNEGLLALVQVAQGRFRYLLHIGHQAPTYGKKIDIAGSRNLDNNVDSRINPYRKNGEKLDSERPPLGFDSLIALNPIARWFNLNTSDWVDPGEVVFHELAEAYAKLEFSLDYLDQGSLPGAHSVALGREERLKSQRPDGDIVITSGLNRLLRTAEEIRLFIAEASAGANQR